MHGNNFKEGSSTVENENIGEQEVKNIIKTDGNQRESDPYTPASYNNKATYLSAEGPIESTLKFFFEILHSLVLSIGYIVSVFISPVAVLFKLWRTFWNTFESFTS